MKAFKGFFAVIFLMTSEVSLAKDCLNSDEVYELYCNELASNMRVKLRSLDSLKEHAKEPAKEAIGWLESSVKTDQVSIGALVAKPACNTKNVKNAMQDADRYFSDATASSNPKKD